MNIRPPAEPWTLGPDDVGEALRSSLEAGLDSAEAARREEVFGLNAIETAAPVAAWRRLLAQFQDPLVYLLVVAVIVSLAAWIIEGAHGFPFEVAVIAVIVLANGLLGYLQEARAEEAVAALQRMAAASATVVRDGETLRVAATSVVPGDIVLLHEGDAVPADARLIEAASLKIIEASLTGESEPVLKDAAPVPAYVGLADRLSMVYSGTAVASGRGRAVVTSTGMSTEMGRIARLLGQTRDEPTPLEREVALVGRNLGIAVIAIAAVVILTILLTSEIDSASALVEVLLVGVSLAVAAVPEGLPAVLSVVLALGVQRMARQRAIVKKLSSVETLGSASVICSDKTGTLTQNEMTITTVVTGSGAVMLSGSGYRPEGEALIEGSAAAERPEGPALLEEVLAVLVGGSLANDAELRYEDGVWSVQGDPTEAAFLVAETKLGVSEQREARFGRIAEVPFTSDRKLMSTFQTDAERQGRVVVFTKGAPDVLLSRCTDERVAGEVRRLTFDRRRQVLATVDDLASRALRPLAVAYRDLDSPLPAADESGAGTAEALEALEHGLVYLGMVGIMDPPRSEAALAIAEAQRAGIRVVMITGDHPRTALRIAEDLGIVREDAPVMTGADIETMDDAALRRLAVATSVYARVAPHHKLRIVDALRAEGNVVAMTGDGVNDAPALRSADIGVAMGLAGTDVTREAADLILADDNFATIVSAVEEGRGIFANIRSFLRYLLSSNAAEVMTMFLGVLGAGLLGLDAAGEAVAVPLLATQILWINLLTDTAPALAIGVDPPRDDVMKMPPRKLTDRLIDGPMQRGVIFLGLVMALASLFALDLRLPGGFIDGSASLDEARTMAFTTLVLSQLFNCFNSRSESASAFHGLFANPWLWAAVSFSFILQVAVVHLPVLNDAFSTAPLSVTDWAICTGLASSVLWASEARKLVVRAFRRASA